ncbi:MAG: hypothetical protein DWH91_02190 [Planctomycetota bacterium]|nr:MAG: hypothetical protein DWH91_02190 [Planctomycetota bacterium]
MAERKYTHGLSVTQDDRATIIDIGDMEIWDGADLSLIRDTLIGMIRKEGVGSIGIDMRCVKYIPSGFFGMLFDWFEQGIEVRLYRPTDRVVQMVWFRQFFMLETDGIYVLHDGSGCSPVLAGDEEEVTWQSEPRLGESGRPNPTRVL